MELNNEYNWHIESKSSLFDLKLKEAWRYRDLFFLLVKRDFISFYKQTILGPLWFFIQPLLTTVIFTFVFGRFGGFSTDGLPQPLFFMAGITAWNYFSDCLIKTSNVFKDSAHIFGKVYFPRFIMPLSIVASNLVKFFVQMILLLLTLVYYIFIKKTNCLPNLYLLLFPMLVLMMGLLGLGLGMIISSMTTKYRDLAFLVSFGVQLLMYATTVVYPLSGLGSETAWIVKLNPMTAIIETFRFGFLGNASFSWGLLGYSFMSSILILIVGIFIFNKVEKTFVDTI